MPRSEANPVLRARIETGIRLAAPLLDVLLGVGDRLSRLLARGEDGHVPPRVERPGEYARRSLTVRN